MKKGRQDRIAETLTSKQGEKGCVRVALHPKRLIYREPGRKVKGELKIKDMRGCIACL